MNQLFICLFLLIIVIIFLSMIKNNQNKEYFSNNEDNYLYPIKNLSPICEKEGLLPSYMPKACYLDGKLDSYANCKCEDKEGNCKICYPKIVKDTSNSSVIYNANVGF